MAPKRPSAKIVELLKEVKRRYWQQRRKDPEKKDIVPLVHEVLNDNGLANDPAHEKMVSQICSLFGARKKKQLRLFPS